MPLWVPRPLPAHLHEEVLRELRVHVELVLVLPDQDLRAAQDDAEFDATLSAAMDKIQAASVA